MVGHTSHTHMADSASETGGGAPVTEFGWVTGPPLDNIDPYQQDAHVKRYRHCDPDMDAPGTDDDYADMYPEPHVLLSSANPWRQAPSARALHFPGLVALPNAGGGDCQFESLAQSLNAYEGRNKDALAARLRLFDMDIGSVLPAQLRDIAYCVFVKPLEELDNFLKQWRMFAGDPSMAGVYDHCKVLLSKRVEALTPSDRTSFVNILTNRHLTWGDETSLLILERLLHVRVDVLTGTYLQKRDHCHPPGFDPIVYVCMNLHMQHYESVVWQGGDGGRMSAWSKQEMPAVLRELHTVHCATAEEAYIRMDADWDAVPQSDSGPATAGMDAHYVECRDVYGAARLAPDLGAALMYQGDGCVSADGGWQYHGEMGPVVVRLQCGLAVNPCPAPAREKTYPDLIPGTAFMRLWA